MRPPGLRGGVIALGMSQGIFEACHDFVERACGAVRPHNNPSVLNELFPLLLTTT